MTSWKQAAVLLALAAMASAAAAPPPVEAFFNDPEISHVTLSPKGHYVAFVHTGADGRQIVAVRDTRDPTKYSVPGTADRAHATIAAIHWVNDERLGFTVMDRRLEFRGNFDEYAADRNGKNLVHLISGNWAQRGDLASSNMTTRLLTAAYSFAGSVHDGSDDIIVQKYMWNRTDGTVESTRLYRLNTRTRALADLLPGAQPARVFKWVLDMDAVPRVAVSSAKGRCIVSYRDRDAAAWTELGNQDCLDSGLLDPQFFDARGTLYVRTAHKGFNALYSYDTAAKKRAAEPLVSFDGFDYNGAPETDLVTRSLVGLHYGTDARATAWFDPAMKALQQKIDALLPGMVNRINCPLSCADAPALLVSATSDREPVQYFIYTPATGKLAALGGARPDIRPVDMGQRDFHRYPARDGRQIPVYVTLPPGTAKGPRPTVVLVHGGPYVRGASWEWEGEAQFLASRGYVVLQPEFRGTPGYGTQHFQAGWKQWGRAMQDDLADAAQWAVKQGWTEPGHVAIMGASYGGYATLMGLIRHPDVFRCGVDLMGVSDIGMMFSVVESDLPQEWLQYGAKVLLGDPADPALAEVSPLAQAARLKQPVLIAHGAEDRRVPIVHARRMKDALAKHNNAVEYLVYDDEGHSLYHRKNRLDFYRRVEAFLAKNLR